MKLKIPMMDKSAEACESPLERWIYISSDRRLLWGGDCSSNMIAADVFADERAIRPYRICIWNSRLRNFN